MLVYQLIPNQANTILFTLINAAGAEVAGLAGTFLPQLAIGTAAPVAGVGAKGENGLGTYYYTFTAGECAAYGPIMLIIPAIGAAIQQNVPCVVGDLRISAVEYTYTVTNSATLAPIPDVKVWVTTDIAAVHVVWFGITDAFGVVRDAGGNKPRLDPGTYYFWKRKIGLIDDQNPDIEVVV